MKKGDICPTILSLRAAVEEGEFSNQIQKTPDPPHLLFLDDEALLSSSTHQMT